MIKRRWAIGYIDGTEWCIMQQFFTEAGARRSGLYRHAEALGLSVKKLS